MFSAYLIHILVIIGIFIILSLSLNLALGYTGLINLAHISFFGIGAYTSALLTLNGFPFLLGFILAGVVAGIFSMLITLITNKLKGDFLAIATLGFSSIVFLVLMNWFTLTRGPLGLPGIPRPEIFGFIIKSNFSYLIFVFIITILTYLFLRYLVGTPYGRTLEAVRDDETGAKAMGKNTYKLKYQSMAMSAFFAGIAGCLYAHYINFIDPSMFWFRDTVIIFNIVIIGGLATLRGSVLAAFLVIGLPELLRFLSLPSSVMGPLRQMLFALALILILIFRPKGLLGRKDFE